jgi:solute carrier family 25 phosphate transporter 3
MIEEEGFSSILFGYPAMLFKQVPYTITKQCSFDLFASSISLYAMSYLNTWPTEEIRFFSTVSAAFLASILACTMSQPGDVILTKKLKGGSEESVFDLASGIYEEKGFGGFYAGFSARLAHVAAIVTTQLVLYDFLKQLLGLPATVSA